MLQSIRSAIRIRTLAVFLLIHLGLALGIFSLARVSFPNGWDVTSSLFLISILCLYGGFLLGVLFIVLPLIPWFKRAERVEHWSERIIRDLPQLIVIFQNLLKAWNDAKTLPASEPEKKKPL